MAKNKKKTPTAVSPQPDAVRIVPLHGRVALESLKAAAPAKLTYRRGPLMSAVEVFTIFWGAGWKAKPQSDMIATLNAFFDFILTSP